MGRNLLRPKRICCFLLAASLALVGPAVRLSAQQPVSATDVDLTSRLISARHVEAEGVFLNGLWQFRLGDNPSWSLPTYDDSAWSLLDPTQPLPDSIVARVRALEAQGKPAIAWFRLHVIPERSLIRKALALDFVTRGAADFFVDNRKILELGDLDKRGRDAAIRRPLLPTPVLFDSATAVLTVRYNLGSALDIQRSLADRALFRARVQPGEAIGRVAEAKRLDGALVLGLFGLFLAVGVLHFLLFLLLRKPISNLHYAAFAGQFAFLYLMLYLAQGTESLRTAITLQLIGNIAGVFALLALITFLYTTFYRRVTRAFAIPAALTTIALVSIVVVLRPHAGAGFGDAWNKIAFVALLGFAVEGIRILVPAVWRRQEGSATIALGFLVMLVGVGYYTLALFGALPMTPHLVRLVYLSFLGLAFAPSAHLAYGFARTSQGFERLSAELADNNRSLEAKVDERTAALNEQMSLERQRATEQKALLDTMADLSQQLSLQQLLQSVLDRAVSLTGTSGAELGIVDEARQELVIVANKNLATDTIGMRLKIHDGAMGHAIKTQQQLIIEDYQQWEGRSTKYEGVLSHAIVVSPLMIGNRPVGAIAVWHDEAHEKFSEGDLRLLNAFAQQSAIAIENARLYTEAQEQRQYFESVVRNSPVAIVTLDLDQNIESANPAFERLFGWGAGEIIGHNLDSLVTDETTRHEAAAITKEAEHGTVHHMGRRRRKDGQYVEVEVLAVPVFLNGERRGLVALYHDITELTRARREAESADQAKSQFLANMSHELRTPLNAVIGYSEMLIEEAGDAGDEGYIPDLQKIHASGRHLLGLINDILDLSKIEAGRMELYLETFDVGATVEEVAMTIRPLIEKNGNSLALKVGDSLTPVRLDQVKVRQILFNLLSNASKFTENGTITLAVAGDADHISFRVSDTGIGMSPEQTAKVFQPFMQADASTTKKYGGTGLGLAITQKFCAMMGGSIELESEAGQGTTFTVTLPTDADRATVTPEPAPTQLDAFASSGTVLVIDDDATAREMLTRMLSKDGYRVVVAGSGEDGLRLAREERPDVITLDVLMAGLDGWGVLTRLKADPLTTDIPVVVVTVIDDRNLGYALGAADYLTKPVERERLGDALRRVRADQKSGPVLVVDDDATTREMLRRILEKDGWRVCEAPNGKVALDRMLEEGPSVVLLDLMMPEMDGFTFIEEVRQRGVVSAAPIIVLTAKTLTEHERQRLQGAVSRVMQKGADPLGEVAAEIRRVMQSAKKPAPAGGRITGATALDA